MFTSLLCYDWPILKQTYQSLGPPNILRGIHDRIFLVKVCIDPLSIDVFGQIYMLNLQCTVIDAFIKHNNKASKHT